jgi:hypothetical protein
MNSSDNSAGSSNIFAGSSDLGTEDGQKGLKCGKIGEKHCPTAGNEQKETGGGMVTGAAGKVLTANHTKDAKPPGAIRCDIFVEPQPALTRLPGILKGFNPPAQGCATRATLGKHHHDLIYPERVGWIQPVPGWKIYVGCRPRVARASQPWADGFNPVGIAGGRFSGIWLNEMGWTMLCVQPNLDFMNQDILFQDRLQTRRPIVS